MKKLTSKEMRKVKGGLGGSFSDCFLAFRRNGIRKDVIMYCAAAYPVEKRA